MWSRYWCAGGGGSILRQRVSFVFNGSHGCGGKVQAFDPLRGFEGECGGRRGGVGFVLRQMKRGVCSTTSVSHPASDGANGNGNSNNNNNNNDKDKDNNRSNDDNGNGTKGSMSFREAKKLMRLANVESLKEKLEREEKDMIPYCELLQECEKMGVARNAEEAAAFAQCLDDAGVILLFRDKVYLHPDKVVDMVRRAVPLALADDGDPVMEELKKMQEKKREIDSLAHKQVRRILWSGLGCGVFTVGLFFRLTFWEFSWDVMEPITYFTTTTGLVVGYAYFLFTSRDPTYQDFMKRLLNSRQKILNKTFNFDVDRFNELQCMCHKPLNAKAIFRNRLGVEQDLEDVLRKD